MSQFTEQKQQVIDACLSLAESGYLAGTGGNLALRLNSEMFAVTPSGADYYTMRADDICVLRLADLEQVEGSKKPSVESAMHATMLRHKPAMQASVHTHQPMASAIALLNCTLEVPDTETRRVLGEQIAIVPYAPSGTIFLVRRFRQCLRDDVHAYLLKNHGVICAAVNLPQAIANMGRIEAIAADFLRRHIKANHGLASPLRALTSQELNANHNYKE